MVDSSDTLCYICNQGMCEKQVYGCEDPERCPCECIITEREK